MPLSPPTPHSNDFQVSPYAQQPFNIRFCCVYQVLFSSDLTAQTKIIIFLKMLYILLIISQWFLFHLWKTIFSFSSNLFFCQNRFEHFVSINLLPPEYKMDANAYFRQKIVISVIIEIHGYAGCVYTYQI